MALKDWKKFPAIKGKNQKGLNINLAWIRKDRNKILYMNEFLIGGAYPDFRKFTGATEWVVHGDGVNRNFDKRSEALKYAKEYMKKN